MVAKSIFRKRVVNTLTVAVRTKFLEVGVPVHEQTPQCKFATAQDATSSIFCKWVKCRHGLVPALQGDVPQYKHYRILETVRLPDRLHIMYDQSSCTSFVFYETN